MNARSLILTFGALGIGASILAAPAAHGQGLSDRIEQMMQKRARAEAQTNASKAEMLGVLLYTDLTLTFEETSARQVIDYLKQALGINIVGRYSDDRTGVGIDPDAEITLDVVDTPALTVLEMVLSQASDDFGEAAWQLRDGFVEVGTKDRLGAKSAQEIRYYPIRDLLFEAPNFDNAPDLDLDSALGQSQGGGGGGGGGGGFGGGGSGGGGSGGGGGGGSIFGDPGAEPERVSEDEKVTQIIDLIIETVEPDAWVDTGGEWATIRYYQGTLIIRAPDFVHRQIGGYPFAVPRAVVRRHGGGQRYVTFTSEFSQVEVIALEPSAPIGGAAGGGGAGAGG